MRYALIVPIGLALLGAVPSDATLIAVDLLAPGDARATRDTVSGLDWLDATETIGLTYDDVAAGAGGWAGDGWRPATTSEVCGLLAQDGAAPGPCPGSGYVGTSGEGQLLLDLLGITFSYDVEWPDGTLTLSQIRALFDDASGDPSLHGFLELSVDRHTAGWAQTYTSVDLDSSSGSESTPLLVRASPIPEPASGLLLALGLGVLAARRVRPGS
jgi:hypothetical protein